ncbi:oxidoreductase, partial [Modestobacter sp. VKM Ac-2980]|nr:oxidoreductase [Modestobacter sp. VKM Ac-2980]
GASRGLGFATARALVDDGARVLISSRAEDGVGSAVESVGRPRCCVGWPRNGAAGRASAPSGP